MASSSKQSSRWGSFLQQAVAGVESRLDNILVGEDSQRPETLVKTSPATAEPEFEPPRTSSTTNPTNDRLQERLARIVAAKNHAAHKPGSRASSNGPTRVGSPASVGGSPWLVKNKISCGNEDAVVEQNLTSLRGHEMESASSISERVMKDPSADSLNIDSAGPPHQPIELNSSVISRRSADASRPIMEVRSMDQSNGHTEDKLVGGQDVDVLAIQVQVEEQAPQKQLQDDPENSDAQRQEEIHGYIELIDALQAKLIYLSRELAESARKSVASAPSSSVEKKLAEKDGQIALLMEEGQKLSKTELKHTTTIKKLRAKASESEKETAEALRRLERSERDKVALTEKFRRAEATEKQANEKQKALILAQKEIESLMADRDAKYSIIMELQAQLSELASKSKANEVKAVQDSLEQEKCRVEELEDALLSLKIEKELAAGRAKARIEELQAINEREAERARIADVEMRAEQQVLESKLEVLRAHTEKVSSGAIGEAQVKFLRQIETLQTQYAVATENWQGIEASMTSRVTSLEKERDDALKREINTRRRAREVTLKLKSLESDLEEARSILQTLQEQSAERESQFDTLQRRSEVAELALIEARRCFDQEKQTWKSEIQHRIEEERVRWQDEFIGHNQAESPVTPSCRGLTAEHLGLQNLQTRQTSARSIKNELPITERKISRKSSAQPVRSSGQATPQRGDSTPLFTNGEASDSPSLHAVEHEEYFESITSPSSSHNIMQDTLSVSTVGAGPSVQLVERMSAAIRRLESEKVSTKEELVRLSAQRDQARAQIVALMQHFEAKKTLDKRVQELEEDNRKMNARYQTTLEMLGEKSELVEELKADVQDVKEMYRELVERTVR